MSTQQPLSARTVLKIRAQMHIQWTGLEGRRHRNTHTHTQNLHLTHTRKTNERLKLACRVQAYFFLQLLPFSCIHICISGPQERDCGAVWGLRWVGAEVVETLLRLLNKYSVVVALHHTESLGTAVADPPWHANWVTWPRCKHADVYGHQHIKIHDGHIPPPWFSPWQTNMVISVSLFVSKIAQKPFSCISWNWSIGTRGIF